MSLLANHVYRKMAPCLAHSSATCRPKVPIDRRPAARGPERFGHESAFMLVERSVATVHVSEHVFPDRVRAAKAVRIALNPQHPHCQPAQRADHHRRRRAITGNILGLASAPSRLFASLRSRTAGLRS